MEISRLPIKDIDTQIILKCFNSRTRHETIHKLIKAGYNYKFKWICNKCEKDKIFYFTKTGMIDKIKYFHTLICNDCLNEIEIDKEKRKEELRKEIEIEARIRCLNPAKETATNKYIERFLIPYSENNVPFEEKWRLLNSDIGVDRIIIHKKICEMKYNEFLKTNYWNLIRIKVLRKYLGLCAICASANNIHIHHRRYNKIHGYELLYWESELIALCSNCHRLYEKTKKGIINGKIVDNELYERIQE